MRAALLLVIMVLGLTLDLPGTAVMETGMVAHVTVAHARAFAASPSAPLAVSPGRAPSHAPATVRTVVGLGDSVPAGSACDCSTYVSLIGEALAARQGTDVVTENLAASGLTTQGLLDQLEDDSARKTLVSANLTIITIGANDFDSSTIKDDDCGPSISMACYKDDLVRLRANMDAILAKLRVLQTRRGSRILVTGYWNVFMDGAMARAEGDRYVTNSDSLTRAVNDTLAASAEAAGVRYVDLYTPFKGESGAGDDTALLADDGDHPGATGHRLIAREVLSALSQD
ncbi:SGNH/GDSL hydrolase family protein [Streptosporangium sp. NPDC051023]|uniref:SGNH/GDSL hydrolase family protein n=1 Tax=Streptosporangium sp. NPDC051023 TaxID=3155410 RepID=UPI00344E1585